MRAAQFSQVGRPSEVSRGTHMTIESPSPVTLTPEEEGWLSQMSFSPAPHGTLRRSCELAPSLARSLCDRRAIPEIRLRYFKDATLNTRGSGSRKEEFERKGIRGDAIFSHGHFLKYLRYFIFGPGLPALVINRFLEAVGREPYYPGDNIEELRSFVRGAIRSKGLDRRRASEEFFKLALECGLSEDCAWDIRKAALSVR